MTYEWGYSGGPAMAVSPIDQVRRVLEYAITEIPPNKIMMGKTYMDMIGPSFCARDCSKGSQSTAGHSAGCKIQCSDSI